MSDSASEKAGILKSGLADELSLRWSAVDLREPLREAAGRLDLSPVAAGALGRCLAGAALLQRMTIKTPSRLVLGIAGDGPLSRVMAEVEDNGNVRGMVSAPQIEIPVDRPGDLGIERAVGNGLLQVWREERGKSYQSQVKMEAGRIGDALTRYLEQSEQTRSAVLLGVLAEREGIAAAGGIMVEALPGTDDETLASFETHLHDLPSVSRILAESGLDGLIEAVLGSSDFSLTGEKLVRYHCRCSDGTIRRYLDGLGQSERDELTTASGSIEVECVFCGQQYRFAVDDLGGGVRTPEAG